MAIIKLLIAGLMKLLNQKATQDVLLKAAKRLAEKTNAKTDDEFVAFFTEIWKRSKK